MVLDLLIRIQPPHNLKLTMTIYLSMLCVVLTSVNSHYSSYTVLFTLFGVSPELTLTSHLHTLIVYYTVCLLVNLFGYLKHHNN